jgi:hypothetical protein
MFFNFLRDRGMALDSPRYLSPLSKADMTRLFGLAMFTVTRVLFDI